MIQMDRETLMMIATIVAIAGVIFLFKEMNKAKQDVENLKNFSLHLMQQFTPSEDVKQVETPECESREISEEKKEE